MCHFNVYLSFFCFVLFQTKIIKIFPREHVFDCQMFVAPIPHTPPTNPGFFYTEQTDKKLGALGN